MLQPLTQACKEPLSIYLHWPFCGSKCPYCDFNSHVRPLVDEDRWVNATITALDYWHGLYPDRRIETIFWGGGTPLPDVAGVCGALALPHREAVGDEHGL